MRAPKEAFLFFLAVCAIVFSYLLATGVFLFTATGSVRSVEARHSLGPSLGKTTSDFANRTGDKTPNETQSRLLCRLGTLSNNKQIETNKG
jgi:hypothetical protein